MFRGIKTTGSGRRSAASAAAKSPGFPLVFLLLGACLSLPSPPVLAQEGAGRPGIAALPGMIAADPAGGTGPAAGEAVSAEESARIMALFAAMGLPQLMPVLAEEGQSYGASLGAATFPGRDGPAWQAAVARLYDSAALGADLAAGLIRALQGQDQAVAGARAFFDSALGQKVVAAEVAARRRLLDPEETEAAEVAVMKLRDARSPRLRLYRALITAGDQIENNVANSLGGALAFEQGLAESEPAATRRETGHMAEQVWAQEGAYRASSEAWIMTYTALAYAELSEAELRAYSDFLASPAGQVVNAALYSASGDSFCKILRGLGREAGLMLRGQQI